MEANAPEHPSALALTAAGDGAERRKHKGKEKAVKEQASKKKSKRSSRKAKARKVSTCGHNRWLPRRRERREDAAL